MCATHMEAAAVASRAAAEGAAARLLDTEAALQAATERAESAAKPLMWHAYGLCSKPWGALFTWVPRVRVN